MKICILRDEDERDELRSASIRVRLTVMRIRMGG